MALVRDGRALDAALRAVRRGVLLDLGHGSGGFSFPGAELTPSTVPLPAPLGDAEPRSKDARSGVSPRALAAAVRLAP